MKTIDIDGYKDIIYVVENKDLVTILENLNTLFCEKVYKNRKEKSSIVIEKYYRIEYLGTIYVIKKFNNIYTNPTYGPMMIFFVEDRLMNEYNKDKNTFLFKI